MAVSAVKIALKSLISVCLFLFLFFLLFFLFFFSFASLLTQESQRRRLGASLVQTLHYKVVYDRHDSSVVCL